VDGCGLEAAIEDDQGAGIQAKAGQVVVDLAQAFRERVGAALAPDFELDALALLLVVAVGLADL
jgi:hypothetical protein